MFFPRTLPELRVSDLFYFISLHLHIYMTSLNNNLGSSCINNCFLWVLILGFYFLYRKIFSKIRIIEWWLLRFVAWLLILACFTTFLFLLFHEIWYGLEFVLLESLWMFIYVLHVLCFFWVLIRFHKKKLVFVFLTSLICF